MNSREPASLRPVSGLAAALLSLLCELGLGGETVTEITERVKQRVDLEQRVLPQLRRLERELEIDRVHAVRDLQHEPRMATVAPPRGRVLDEDVYEGVAVQTRTVQAR